MKKAIQNFAIVTIPIFALFASLKLKATPSIPTGSCAALMSLKTVSDISGVTFINGPGTISKSTAVDALILLNFSESKIYINKTIETLTLTTDANYSTSGNVEFQSETVPAITFSISDGPLPGSIVVTATGNPIPNLMLLPANSGNTYLIQAMNDKATGVCQKV